MSSSFSVSNELFQYIEQIVRWMHEHFDQPVDIEGIAKKSGTSTNRFYKAFRMHTGLTPHTYVTSLRLNEAIRQLGMNNERTVADVAFCVGYKDEYYFSRLFKKQFHLTPSQFQTLAAKRVANLSPVFDGDFHVFGIDPVLNLQRGWSQKADVYLDEINRTKPDVIITSPVKEDVSANLEQIAPVVTIYWKRIPWRNRLFLIGETFKLQTVARRWLSWYEMKQRIAQRHLQQLIGDQSFLIVSVRNECLRLVSWQPHQTDDLSYSEMLDKHGCRCSSASWEWDDLREWTSYKCKHVVCFVHDSVPAERYEEFVDRWKQLAGGDARCFVIRHSEKLICNALANENVLNLLMRELFIQRFLTE